MMDWVPEREKLKNTYFLPAFISIYSLFRQSSHAINWSLLGACNEKSNIV